MRTFGPYELQGLLGRGGMGEVYRALDTEQDRIVALKLLPDTLSSDPRFAERFRRESHTTARLRDPHVIPIHRYGEIDGRLFIDMRLVDGVDLGRTIARDGPLDPGRAVAVVGQIAQALDAAHADGLVHRDVKPSNVLLTSQSFVYLVDFGIAHLLDGAPGHEALTTTGTAVGTVAYMAPERFAPGPPGSSADIYSLACVLYECLTGEVPFPVDGLLPAIYAHGAAPPPRPSAQRPDLPPGLDEVIAIGMAKEPAQRFRSAGELAAAAQRALDVPPAPTTMALPLVAPFAPPTAALPLIELAAIEEPPPPRRRAGRIAAGVVGVLVVVAAAVAVVLLAPWAGSPERAPGSAAPPASGSARPGTDEFPQSFWGTWSGRLQQTGGSVRTFVAELVITPSNTATLRFVDLECSGTLHLGVPQAPGLPPGTLSAVEQIESGPCSSGVAVTLRQEGRTDSLTYAFTGPGSSGSGTLMRS